MTMLQKKPSSRLALIAAGVLLAIMTPALAQEQAPREPARADDAPNAEQARRYINRQIEKLDRQQERLHKALQMLDEGQTAEQIRELLGDEGAGRRAQRPQLADFPIDDLASRQRARAPEVGPETALKALSELNPGLHRRLRILQERDPDRFKREVRRLLPRLAPMVRQRQAHPDQWDARVKVFHAEQEARRVARQATMATDDDERKARIGELRELISRQFTHRERIHEMQIKRAERNVGQQRQRLEEARANRPQLVAQRVEEMLRRAAQDELLDDRQPRRRRENPGL